MRALIERLEEAIKGVGRVLKPSEVDVAPYKGTKIEGALAVTYEGKSIGLLIPIKGGWKGQTQYKSTGIQKTQEAALKAMLKDSPDAVVR